MPNDVYLDNIREDVVECERILSQREDARDFVPLEEVRWFDLDDLEPMPDELSLRQKQHLRDAVQRMHAAGIVHNDLHEGNILISKDDHLPRIIDFGEALTRSQLEGNDFERRKRADVERLERLFRNPSPMYKIGKTQSRFQGSPGESSFVGALFS